MGKSSQLMLLNAEGQQSKLEFVQDRIAVDEAHCVSQWGAPQQSHVPFMLCLHDTPAYSTEMALFCRALQFPTQAMISGRTTKGSQCSRGGACTAQPGTCCL